MLQLHSFIPAMLGPAGPYAAWFRVKRQGLSKAVPPPAGGVPAAA